MRNNSVIINDGVIIDVDYSDRLLKRVLSIVIR